MIRIKGATVKLAPSVLSADFGRLGEQVAEAEAAGADYIHVDVMDGHFVPNLTVGPLIVEALRPRTRLPLDVHLMVTDPERWIPKFASAGADALTVHAETTSHPHRTIQHIKERGIKAGVSLNPGTSPVLIQELLPTVDLILVMSVNPGFGGQSFIANSLAKIETLRGWLDALESPAELSVDGGLNDKTIGAVVSAGARVLVAGSAIFNDRESVAAAMDRLRSSLAAKETGH